MALEAIADRRLSPGAALARGTWQNAENGDKHDTLEALHADCGT